MAGQFGNCCLTGEGCFEANRVDNGTVFRYRWTLVLYEYVRVFCEYFRVLFGAGGIRTHGGLLACGVDPASGLPR